MANFQTSDVIAVAKALLEDYAWFDTGDYSKDQYVCNYCDARTGCWAINPNRIKHELDCPVLIARDLLTGYEERT